MAKPPLLYQLANGDWGTVDAVVLTNGNCPARKFVFEELARNERARALNLFQVMADQGSVPSKRLKSEEGFQAFSIEVNNRQIRFPCFQDGQRWVVTHGFIKPGAKKGRGPWPRSEIDRANRIIAEYRSRKSSIK
jgi:hypothetical protein